MSTKGLVNAIAAFNLLHIQTTLYTLSTSFFDTFLLAFRNLYWDSFTDTIKSHDGSCRRPVEQETSHKPS
jgi:hypothetical protein